MKKIAIISALLLLTLSISAQSSRSRSSRSSSENARTKETRKSNPRVSDRSSDNKKHSVTRTTTRTTRTKVTTPEPQSKRPAHSYENRSGNSNSNRGHSSSARTTTRSTSVSVEPNRKRPAATRTTTTRTTTSRTKAVEPRSSGRSGDNGRVANRSSDNRREATSTRARESRTTVSTTTRTRISRPEEYRPVSRTAYKKERTVYHSYHPTRVVRKAPTVRYHVKPLTYRKVHYPYRRPVHVDIIWDINMYNDYIYLYPNYRYWYYPFGYRVPTVSAYEVGNYIGEIARVYGRVYDTWYSRESDEYYLYFGAPFPFQDFSIIVEGNDARRYSWRPARYFKNRDIAVTGLIGIYDGKPEMVVKRSSQIDVY